ncbi:MAG TPA: DUF58 domain-containing protein [Limnochordia bacterium]
MIYWRRCLLFLFVAALFFRGKMIYVALYTLAIVFFASRYALRKAFQSLKARRRLSESRVFIGEETEVELELDNPTRLPLVWVMATEELPPELMAGKPKQGVLSLGPRRRAAWRYTVIGRARGVHPLGPVQLEAGDPFGLEIVQGRMDLVDHLVVYPKIRPLADLGLPSRLPFGEVRTARRFFEDPARTIGARPYTPGDSFNRIHWKLSAKANAIYVKEYQPTIALETAIVLNLREDEYDVHLIEFYSELAIEVAASVAYYLSTQRQNVALITNGVDPLAVAEAPAASRGYISIPAHKGAGHLMRLLELLAKIRLGAGAPSVSMLIDAASRLPWGATVVVITPSDPPELIDALLKLQQAGYNVAGIVVGRVQHETFLHRSPQSGFVLYQVRSETDLDGLARRRPSPMRRASA